MKNRYFILNKQDYTSFGPFDSLEEAQKEYLCLDVTSKQLWCRCRTQVWKLLLDNKVD